jgi:hypothetical protein
MAAAAEAAGKEAKANEIKQAENEPSKLKSLQNDLDEVAIYGTVKEEFVKQPFKNAEQAFKDAMNMLAQEDW